jgi:hypothetical protein
LARIPKELASDHNNSRALITTSRAVLAEFLEGVETMLRPFGYDPELMEKARWIVERGLDRPREHEIERQMELPLPMPAHKPEMGEPWADVALPPARQR